MRLDIFVSVRALGPPVNRRRQRVVTEQVGDKKIPQKGLYFKSISVTNKWWPYAAQGAPLSVIYVFPINRCRQRVVTAAQLSIQAKTPELVSNQ